MVTDGNIIIIGIIGRYHSDQREIPDKKVFAVDNPKTDFSLKNPCCPPLPLQPKFSKSAATRRGKRSARGARAIDPPRGEKNEFEPYFLRFSASLGVKSTPFFARE